MKKNKKVAQSAERKLQKKKELEHISNKELIVFTVGLVAEVILMFFYSALRSTVQVNAGWVLAWSSLAFFIIFIALIVCSIVNKNKGADEKMVKSLRNWGFCSLAFAAGALFISAGRIITSYCSAHGIDTSTSLARFFVSGSYFAPSNAVVITMILVALYVIAAMIYYGILSAKVKKSK